VVDVAVGEHDPVDIRHARHDLGAGSWRTRVDQRHGITVAPDVELPAVHAQHGQVGVMTAESIVRHQVTSTRPPWPLRYRRIPLLRNRIRRPTASVSNMRKSRGIAVMRVVRTSAPRGGHIPSFKCAHIPRTKASTDKQEKLK
jgi:hypothetical protein